MKEEKITTDDLISLGGQCMSSSFQFWKLNDRFFSFTTGDYYKGKNRQDKRRGKPVKDGCLYETSYGKRIAKFETLKELEESLKPTGWDSVNMRIRTKSEIDKYKIKSYKPLF